MGVIITVAEPDLAMFASQIASLNKWVFIFTVGAGIGFYIYCSNANCFSGKIKYILLISYLTIIVLTFFVPKEFITIAFDSSGVTTGQISTPFILAFGLGISAVRASKKSQEDSFGLIAIASIGPILFVLLLSFFHRRFSNYSKLCNFASFNQCYIC